MIHILGVMGTSPYIHACCGVLNKVSQE